MVQEFAEGYTQDVPVNGRHALEAPVFGALANQPIEAIDVVDGCLEEVPREAFHFAVGSSLEEKSGAHLLGRVAPQFPLIEHLHRVFARFSS